MSDSTTPSNSTPVATAAAAAPAAKNGWYVRDARTLRMNAQLTLTKTAGLADVSRDSVSNIESNHAVTELIAVKVFGALNKAQGDKLKREDYVFSGPSSGPVQKRKK